MANYSVFRILKKLKLELQSLQNLYWAYIFYFFWHTLRGSKKDTLLFNLKSIFPLILSSEDFQFSSQFWTRRSIKVGTLPNFKILARAINQKILRLLLGDEQQIKFQKAYLVSANSDLASVFWTYFWKKGFQSIFIIS